MCRSSVADPDLAAALVDAYRPYVMRLVEEREWGSVEGLVTRLEEGERWLRAELEALLALPFAEQTRGPLEVFQEAMRFPTEVLAANGVPLVARDEVAEHALPGDVYDLAPASSRDLGEQVWVAHLTWGARKAAALRDR